VAAADDRRDIGDVERYEALRRRALGGEASGWRLGLALVQRRGVAAWARASHEASPPTPLRPAAAGRADGDALVGVLATMALACVGAG